MIQFKAKNKYWQAGRRWKTVWAKNIKFENLDFDDYQYIIGDTIFTEATVEAEEAFNTVKIWMQLHGK